MEVVDDDCSVLEDDGHEVVLEGGSAGEVAQQVEVGLADELESGDVVYLEVEAVGLGILALLLLLLGESSLGVPFDLSLREDHELVLAVELAVGELALDQEGLLLEVKVVDVDGRLVARLLGQHGQVVRVEGD